MSSIGRWRLVTGSEKAHWGQGFATEVLKGFTRWAFENIPDLLRLEAGVFGGNDPSVRVLTKAGYTFEGARRKAGFKFGKSFDIRILGMLKEECSLSWWRRGDDTVEKARGLTGAKQEARLRVVAIVQFNSKIYNWLARFL